MKSFLCMLIVSFAINASAYGFIRSLVEKCGFAAVAPTQIQWAADQRFEESEVVFLSGGSSWGRVYAEQAALHQAYPDSSVREVEGLDRIKVSDENLEFVKARFKNTSMSADLPYLFYHSKMSTSAEPYFPFKSLVKKFSNITDIANASESHHKPIVFDLTHFSLGSKNDFVDELEYYHNEAFLLVYILNSPKVMEKTRFLYKQKELSFAEAKKLLSPIMPENFDIRKPGAWVHPTDSVYEEFQSLEQGE